MKPAFSGVVAGLDDYQMLMALDRAKCLPDADKYPEVKVFNELGLYSKSRFVVSQWRKFVNDWKYPKKMEDVHSVKIRRVGPLMGIFRMQRDRWWRCIEGNQLPDLGEDFWDFDIPQPVIRFFQLMPKPIPPFDMGLGLIYLLIIMPWFIVGLIIALMMIIVLIIPTILFMFSLLLMFSINVASMGRLNRRMMLWRVELSNRDEEKLGVLTRAMLHQGAILAPVWMSFISRDEVLLHGGMKQKHKSFYLALQLTLYCCFLVTVTLPLAWYHDSTILFDAISVLVAIIGFSILFSWAHLIYEPQRRLAKLIEQESVSKRK